jgi:transaldolase / glucose-6-phosphate isomerase
VIQGRAVSAGQPGWELSGVDLEPRGDLVSRVWNKDSSVWGPGEDDPAHRLGWLELPQAMSKELERLEDLCRSVVADGIRSCVLLGMGGSSLAPEVFWRTFGGIRKQPSLVVLDSTHPAQIRAVRESLDLDRTLWLVSSKSGTTVETMSLYRYFRALIEDGRRFIAITDPGTALEHLAATERFREIFLNPPDLGGRYSALSLFGLVPAALIGADLGDLLAGAREAADECRRGASPSENPGLAIGLAMGELASTGRDKLTFVISDAAAAFGDWVEQLLAESTGKLGKGIVPIVGEPQVSVERYGRDRAFAYLRLRGDDSKEGFIARLRAAGHPVIRIDFPHTRALGAQMFVWEFATAVAGSILGINPFDQPNVEAAKRATKEVLGAHEDISWADDDPARLFEGLEVGELAALLAFAPRSNEAQELLDAARKRLLRDHSVATMTGFGPRYLHSTGQLLKGGPPKARVLVVLDEPGGDEPIPGSDHGFSRLVVAQAVGDVRALRRAGRRVATTTWDRFARWAAA